MNVVVTKYLPGKDKGAIKKVRFFIQVYFMFLVRKSNIAMEILCKTQKIKIKIERNNKIKN